MGTKLFNNVLVRNIITLLYNMATLKDDIPLWQPWFTRGKQHKDFKYNFWREKWEHRKSVTTAEKIGCATEVQNLYNVPPTTNNEGDDTRYIYHDAAESLNEIEEVIYHIRAERGVLEQANVILTMKKLRNKWKRRPWWWCECITNLIIWKIIEL